MSTQPRTALCAGSFDPLTRGHEDVVLRALAVADRVVVAVSHSPTSAKSAMREGAFMARRGLGRR